MNRRAFLPLVAVLVPLAAGHAQQRALVSQRVEPSLYEFKNLDGPSAQAVCRVAGALYGVLIDFSPNIRLALISPNGPAVATDWRDRTIEFLKRYDTPPAAGAQVHYLAYLIRAGRSNSGTAKLNPIPKELDDAITEMKRSMIYTRYDLLSAVATVSEGGASSTDRLIDGQYAFRYTIDYGRVTVASDHKSVSIRPFQFKLETPGPTQYNLVSSISSDITVHEGQKLVLGKVRLNDDADLFVILTVKVE